MPRFTESSFSFGPEFGERLRALRKARNLSLRELALLMDRPGAGSHRLLGKLEHGKVRSPSISVVLDYLRACGARTSDVADLLDDYLRKRPVPRARADAAVEEALKELPAPMRRAMLEWDKVTADAREARAAADPQKKKHRVETDRQRVFRIIWSFIHANWSEEFETRLFTALLRHADEIPRSRRRDAGRHARRMFGVMTRHYASPARRLSALEREKRRTGAGGFSDVVVQALLGAATDAYLALSVAGRLDWEPTEEDIVRNAGRAPKVLRAEVRMELDELAPSIQRNRWLNYIRSLAMSAVENLLASLKLDWHDVKQYYYRWVDRLFEIAGEHGADSPEWRAEVDRAAPRLHDEKVARQAAAIAANVYEAWKKTLPPKSDIVA